MAASTDWSAIPISADRAALAFDTIPESDCARLATLEDVVDRLACPDTGARLQLGPRGLIVEGSDEILPLKNGRPVLLPKYARDILQGSKFAFSDRSHEVYGQQYLQLLDIKMNGGPQNSEYGDIWFQRHVHRARALLSDAAGLVLDIGCDKPSISRRLYPPTAVFLGLEPSLESSEFNLCAMAEHLPLQNESVDAVSFMTSLDHILDYHLAIDEGRRVLKPGGRLYLANLVWTSRASLTGDTVHFHHFRDFELIGVLQGLVIEKVTRHTWKDDSHRYGIYLSARKPA